MVPSPDPESSLLGVDRPPERRQLTVVFCDLVGSTALAERFDPEDLRDILRAYRETATAVVERFGGHVAQHLGDGLLIYFGYPRAREDDPRRAVLAALGILERMAALDGRLTAGWDLDLAVRVGIHTGQVVTDLVGSGPHREQLALGETPNVAARLQGLAAPDTVVVSEATRRLTRDFFTFEPLGSHTLKGLSRPMALWQAVGERGAEGILREARDRGFTPLVGREWQITELRRLLAEVAEGSAAGGAGGEGGGEGRAVLVRGDAGIGKSRLVIQLREEAEAAGWGCLLCRSSSYHQSSPLHPFVELLRELFGFERSDPPARQRRRIEAFLEGQRGSGPSEPAGERRRVGPLVERLADLLSIPEERGGGSTPEPPEASAGRRREQILGALLELLAAQARRRPLLFVAEDLHWADPSTLELLGRWIEHGRGLPVLILMTARRSFEPPWAGPGAPDPVLDLERLGSVEAEALVGQVVRQSASGAALPPETVRQLVERADGIPLFLEELTRMAVEASLEDAATGAPAAEAGGGPGTGLPEDIPSSLQDFLTSRLDRLTTGRGVAQRGALLGREFSREMLMAVFGEEEATREDRAAGFGGARAEGTGLDDTLAPGAEGRDGAERRRVLEAGLAELRTAGLLFESGSPGAVRYTFKHALVQDAARQSLLRRQRERYHRRIAGVLVSRYPETARFQPELVAHHYTEGRALEPAVEHWILAGRRSAGRSALVEAQSHLSRALELLDELDPPGARAAGAPSPEVDARRLEAYTHLGPVLMAVKGYGAEEVEEVYRQARALSERLGDARSRFPAVLGLVRCSAARAELAQAGALGQELLELAEAEGDPRLLREALRPLGGILFHLGDFAGARRHLSRALELHDAATAEEGRPQLFPHAEDPGVFCLSYGAWAQWFLGHGDRALAQSREALDRARRAEHPFSEAYALAFGALVHHLRGEAEATAELAEATLAIATEHGFPHRQAMGRFLAGWAQAALGDLAGGIETMDLGLRRWLACGAKVLRPQFLTLLGRAHLLAGSPPLARAFLDEAVLGREETGETFYDAPLHRTLGEVLLAEGRPDEAAAAYGEALAVSRSQGAVPFELEIARDRVELLATGRLPGDPGAARADLERAIGRFEGASHRGGASPPVLRQARQLLAEAG